MSAFHAREGTFGSVAARDDATHMSPIAWWSHMDLRSLNYLAWQKRCCPNQLALQLREYGVHIRTSTVSRETD